jgi:CRISPR type I-D-associated protein Csc3/Cas10d
LTGFADEAAALFVPGLATSWQGQLLPKLRRYVRDNLTVGGLSGTTPPPPDFAGAFKSYAEAKQPRRATLPCTICNSAYLLERKQADSEVLFQPWVYKNRLPLNASENAGGICAVCLLEIMLRQLKQQGELRLTGKDFEETQTKFFYLYPNYFFTTETAALVQRLTERLQDVQIGSLQRAIGDTALDPADYLGLDVFNPPDVTDGRSRSRTYYRMEYAEHDTQSLIFFGHRPLGKDPTASEAWAIPALLSLMLPVALGCKVAVADSYLPLFGGGEEFQETVVLDAAHPFLAYLLPSEARDRDHLDAKQQAKEPMIYTPAGRIRIDRVLTRLRVLTRVYGINYDTYNKAGDPGWNMISRTARRIRTDPLNIFYYLAAQARAANAGSLLEGYWPRQVERYMRAYRDIWNGLGPVIGGDDPMRIIEGLVERYAPFYSPHYRSASIVRPVEIAAKLVLDYPYDLSRTDEAQADQGQDIQWMLRGELSRWLDRLRRGEGSGRARFYGTAIPEREEPAVSEFVRFFYETVYLDYCRGEAGLLRSRLNNIKSGCEAYYSANRAKWSKRSDGSSDPSEEMNGESDNELTA